MKALILTLVLIMPVIANPCEAHYMELKGIAKGMGFVITSEMGGGHNGHSKHYKGKAVDVRTRHKSNFQIDMLKMVIEQNGFLFRDERVRPKGQRIWSGPHIHLSIPYCD